MPQNNWRLIAIVAAVAVAAVAVGGALAYRQGPSNGLQAEAAPLAGSPSPTPSATTATPTPRPTATPSASPTYTGQTKITLDVSKLLQGREPQIPYLVGREVRGGSGDDTTLPGTGGVIALGRLDIGVLAIVQTGNDGTELLQLDNDKVVRRTPGVTSLVTTPDQSSAAYAAARITSLGAATKGGVLFSQTSDSVKSIKLPDSWNLRVLAYVDGTVYYRSDDTENGPGKLYSWTPGAAKAVLVKTVTSPTAVSADGRLAASMGLINDRGTCSSVVEVATGKQLFRTCEYRIFGFSPDGTTAIAGSAYGDGYCDTIQSALEVATGKLLRQWSGCFHQSVTEDDQHVLIVAVASGGGGDPGTKSAIIRCTITTGACELATPISTDKELNLGS